MPRVPVQHGEWRPDLATLDTQYASEVENVLPGSNSYLPVPDLSPFGDTPVPPPPASEPIVGLTSARKTDGIWQIYAGSTKKLYRWNFSGWTDVTRTTGGDYAVPNGELWSWAQYGKYLYAVQIGDFPQRIDLDAGTNFAAVPGSPPKAHNVRTIGEFVILGGLAAGSTISGTTVHGTPRSILWCSIGDPSAWQVGLGLCDMQEFPDHGPVKGVAGDKIGYVLQDRAINLMQFLPGDTTLIFSFSQVVYDRGS